MGILIDLTGKKFGRLEVVGRSGASKFGSPVWECKCSCGNSKLIDGISLRRGDSKSCGCLNREISRALGRDRMTTHGMTKTATYGSWRRMKERCYYPSNNRYKYYGARGIKVCDKWLGKDGFVNFLKDMGERPEGMSIDRIKNDGNYGPDNCKWATAKEQIRNRSTNVFIEYSGERMIVQEWAEKIGISYDALKARLHKGWSVERALTQKPRVRAQN